MVIPLYPAPFRECRGQFFSYVDCFMSNAHRSFCSVLFWYPPQKHLSIGRALIFHIHIGIHPRTMCQHLVYHYLFQEYASFSLKNFFAFCNRPFIIFLQTPYLATGRNLSWVELVMVKLVVSIREIDEIRRIGQLLKVVILILI